MNVPDFEAWDLFVAVAEAGSFAGAARSRGLSVPTVSRAIARLEARLGGALFHRTSRRLSLSALGEDALGEAQALVLAASRMEERLGEATTLPAGRVRLAVPLEFGSAHIAPLLPPFLAAHPNVEIELSLDDARIDIVASGHDVVLRIGQLADSSLIARRLCQVEVLAVASPGYLAAHGRPKHPADLARHQCLIYTNVTPPDVWRFVGPEGAEYSVTVSGPLRANSGGALTPALVAGAGIAIHPDFLLCSELASGRVETLLPGWRLAPLGLYMITPPSPLRPLRVRLLMEHLAAGLRNPPWRNAETMEQPKLVAG
ncbi:LysR family transcriptional regulator [Sandaracinobacter sp. RS1-74]|uniref:LysR family transcriptional regulator n=1 Tax=Sandaracinobacteroides sayramensis TaxID=2913411 RepID=UPI001ED9D4EC|nr:LysR family transcriptional regulator [Sandaracinobacteroides sayramensis]MCG2839614.1 LysR family transcriptional regulator [Sandaracinobacteroides sayramensis]